jgi:hypothetical protein
VPETISNHARLGAVSIEYLVRLKYVVGQSTTWSRGTEYQAIRGKILDVCQECWSKLFNEAALFRRIYQGKTLSEADILHLRTLLRTTSGTFIALHELLLFLPRESIRRELRDYCECLFRPEFKTTKISLMLTSLFAAFEYSLDEVMRFLEADVFKSKVPKRQVLPFGNVLELAIVDRSNPLAWAVLAHEFGHYLDHTSDITKRAVDQFVKKRLRGKVPESFITAWKRLCSEIVADLTGYYLLGPCSILPLVNMSLLVGCLRDLPIEYDREHGAPTTRVLMIRKLCEHDGIDAGRINPLLDTLIEEETRKAGELPQKEQQNRTTIEDFLTDFFDAVRPGILRELKARKFRQFTARDYKNAESLAQNLANGLPVGSCRSHSDDEVREKLLTPRGDDWTWARKEYHLLTEHAVGVGEVISAGWIDRIDLTADLFLRAFSEPDQEKAFSYIAKRLEEHDDLILKSIDMIPILEAQNAP